MRHDRVAQQTSTKVTTVASRVRERAPRRPIGSRCGRRTSASGRRSAGRDYWDRAELVAHALLALGIEPGDRVAIHSENRREWLYCRHRRASRCGRPRSGCTRPTRPPRCTTCSSHSGAKVLVAEDQEQVDKALGGARPSCPTLETIVYLEPRGIRHRYDRPGLMSWEELLELGARPPRAGTPTRWTERMAEASAEDMLTSSTPRAPPGRRRARCSRVANVEFAIEMLVDDGGFTSRPRPRRTSCCPTCRCATSPSGSSPPGSTPRAGIQVHFAESIETVPANLREVQPTILFGVPRIWEKMLAGVADPDRPATRLKRVISRLWLGWPTASAETWCATAAATPSAPGCATRVGLVVLLPGLQGRLGMRKVRYAASGAAPIAPRCCGSSWASGCRCTRSTG